MQAGPFSAVYKTSHKPLLADTYNADLRVL